MRILQKHQKKKIKSLCYVKLSARGKSSSSNFEVHFANAANDKLRLIQEKTEHKKKQITRDKYGGRCLSLRIEAYLCRLLIPPKYDTCEIHVAYHTLHWCLV